MDNCFVAVSGYAKCGELLAIMGASGAGKTTLLNVLTGRNLGNLLIDGEVFINGNLARVDTIKANSAYIQQEDLLIGTLTVKEHLMFQVIQGIGKITKKCYETF